MKKNSAPTYCKGELNENDVPIDISFGAFCQGIPTFVGFSNETTKSDSLLAGRDADVATKLDSGLWASHHWLAKCLEASTVGLTDSWPNVCVSGCKGSYSSASKSRSNLIFASKDAYNL